MSIYRKPSKWKNGEFPKERILSIALHQQSFIVDIYNPRDRNRANKAKRMTLEGYLKYEGIEGRYRTYTITPQGKEFLLQLRSKP